MYTCWTCGWIAIVLISLPSTSFRLPRLSCTWHEKWVCWMCDVDNLYLCTGGATVCRGGRMVRCTRGPLPITWTSVLSHTPPRVGLARSLRYHSTGAVQGIRWWGVHEYFRDPYTHAHTHTILSLVTYASTATLQYHIKDSLTPESLMSVSSFHRHYAI